MSEAYGFNEQAMREVLRRLNEVHNKYDNLARRLATYSTRRHEAVYMPGVKQVALAYFTAHVAPYVTSHGAYNYPSRTASTQDHIFPAYIYRDVSWVDNPSGVGWSVNQALNVTETTFDEPVFIYNLRRNYVPTSDFLIPVYKIDDKWYVNYVRPPGVVHITGGGASLSTSPHNFTSGSSDDGIETMGWPESHPLTYDSSTGEITFHRNCRVMLQVSCYLTNGSSVASPYHVTSGFAAGVPAGGGYGSGAIYFPANAAGAALNSLSWFSAFDANAGDHTQLAIQMNSTAGSQACTLTEWNVAIDTREAF